tara:strand:+ start:206 stop:433 length:228 start_codon:yes stop_codon:yes gene_type:complete
MNREQKGLNMNIDFSQTTEVCCDECGHDIFTEVLKLRKLSALLSPTGQETMIPIKTFACAKCGHINPDFLPKEKE